MSIKYKDNLITPWANQIDNKAADTSHVKSSAYIQGLVQTFLYNIDKIGAVVPSVKGIVGSYADLATYDTTKLVDKDILYVLADETHDNRTAYYRWTGAQPFEYIGALADYYTPTEVDTFLNARQDKLVDTVNIKTIGGLSVLGEGDLKVGYYLNIMYPVGSIYMTTDKDFRPDDKFGGRWSKITYNERILYASGDEFPDAEATAGQSQTYLTSDNIPRHTHVFNPHTHTASSNGVSNNSTSTIPSGVTYWAMPIIRGISSSNNDGMYDDFELGTSKWEKTHTKWTDTDWLPIQYTASMSMYQRGVTIDSTGGAYHENTPPCYTVFMWKRYA